MPEPTSLSPARTSQLFAITIDQNALGQRNSNVEHEREGNDEEIEFQIKWTNP